MSEADLRAELRERGGDELVERLDALDRVTAKPPAVAKPRVPDSRSIIDADVVIAGGGLSILYAPLLAESGLRVVVVERGKAGVAHREWNASRLELQRLELPGLFTDQEIEHLIVARYDRGICRWHGGGTHVVRGALDCAVDATRLLALARQRAESKGVRFIDYATVLGHAAGRDAVRVVIEKRNGERDEICARVLVDARGAASPYARADLVCPTVGGVMTGLDVGTDATAIDPTVGEILVTTEGIEEGRQHLWEAFPGQSGETTVYAFYYALREELTRGALTRLYLRFFQRLSHYKSGDARLVRPTFGLIPGWSRLHAPPKTESPRIILVGDAAARHSPLTFCGFGATLRSLRDAASSIVRATSGASCDSVVDDRPIHTGTGALSLLLATPSEGGDPARLNRLLDAAFGSLAQMNDDAFARLLRDELSAPEFMRFLLETSRRHPSVYRDVLKGLGARRSFGWAGRVSTKWISETAARNGISRLSEIIKSR